MKFGQKNFSNKMTQPATLIVSFKDWKLLVKNFVVTVSPRWEDFVVPCITKEPDRADDSLEDLSCRNPAFTPN